MCIIQCTSNRPLAVAQRERALCHPVAAHQYRTAAMSRGRPEDGTLSTACAETTLAGKHLCIVSIARSLHERHDWRSPGPLSYTHDPWRHSLPYIPKIPNPVVSSAVCVALVRGLCAWLTRLLLFSLLPGCEALAFVLTLCRPHPSSRRLFFANACSMYVLQS